MVEHVSFEEGLVLAERRILDCSSKPVMVGVYGTGNSGKSHFIQTLGDILSEQGLRCLGGGAAPRYTNFSVIAKHRNGPLAHKLQDVTFLHMGWERWAASNDYINQLIEETGVGIDLYVRLYDPKHKMSALGEYDIVIRNDDATSKPPLPK